MANDGKAWLTMGAGIVQSSLGSNHPPEVFDIVVVSYGKSYTSQMNSLTVRSRKHNYPIRVKEENLQFTVQCRNVDEYDKLIESIRTTQVATLAGAQEGIVRFVYPDLKLDYLGYIISVPAGVRRFDYTPSLPITMALIKDTINSETTQYSSLDGSWQDIFGTSIVDLYAQNPLINSGNPTQGTIPPSNNGKSGIVRNLN